MNVKVNGGGRIKPFLKIFDECRSLTGLGELNPYWRSSMNVKFNGVGRIKPLLKIFDECRSLTEVGEYTLIEDLQWM